MESVSLVFSCVLDSEEVPLAEALGSVVILEVALILVGANFHGFSQISTLKSGLKLECLIDWQTYNGSFSVGCALRWLLNLRVVDSVVRLQLFIVPIEPRASSSAPLLGGYRCASGFSNLAVLVRLLQAVR